MEIMKVILTSLLSAAALFLLTKVMGHKQISQLDFFDYITGIPVGSSPRSWQPSWKNPSSR